MNKSVDKAINILRVISENNQGLTLSEIVRICKYPKTTVYDILCSLEKHKMIYKRDDRMTYSIGFLAYSIGSCYSRTSHLLQNSSQLCEQLSEKIGKSVLLGKLQGSKIFYVQKSTNRRSLINIPEVGDYVDLKQSALSIVFAAYSTEEVSIKAPANLKNECIKNGYAKLEIKEVPSLWSIAVPVFNFENELAGGVEILGLYNNQALLDADVVELCETATKISANLGFSKDMLS